MTDNIENNRNSANDGIGIDLQKLVSHCAGCIACTEPSSGGSTVGEGTMTSWLKEYEVDIGIVVKFCNWEQVEVEEVSLIER